MKLRSVIALSLPLIGSSVMAANLAVKLDIPQLNVAEYHRPYLALWLEDPGQKFVVNLAVLYDVKKKDNAGAKWLKDMRQWWRKSGRDLMLPIDGVSGATRAPGTHTLAIAGAQLEKLPAGHYQVVVEAARESGGRELVRVPIDWPPKTALTVPAKGVEELGNVVVQLKP